MICTSFEQDLALVAANCLDPERELQVRDHCLRCSNCAVRLKEFERVAQAQLEVSHELERVPLSRCLASVRQDYLARHRQEFTRENPAWRWLMPIGTLACLGLALLFTRQEPSLKAPAPTLAPMPSLQPIASLARYRIASEKEGDSSLDAVLARDDRHLLRATSEGELRRLQGEL